MALFGEDQGMPTDLWGVVVPNWIAALGGFAATVLAIVSLVLAQTSRREARAARASAEEAQVAGSVTREVVEGVIAEASEAERRGEAWRTAVEPTLANPSAFDPGQDHSGYTAAAARYDELLSKLRETRKQ